MGNRTHTFEPGGYYHLYDRGVEKRRVFQDDADHWRFLHSLAYYQQEQTTVKFSRSGFEIGDREPPLRFEIICYALMPTHFHLLVRVITEEGIPAALAQLLTSYTKYFNTRYERVGSLFQGVYQSVPVQSDDQLLHLIRYILLNPFVAGLEESIGAYPWTSYREHIAPINDGLSDTHAFNALFPDLGQLNRFLNDYADYARQLGQLKNLIFD